MQTLELDGTFQCVVECRSLAKVDWSPIAFGDQTYPWYGPRPCKEKHPTYWSLIRIIWIFHLDLQSPLPRWAGSCPTMGSRWEGSCRPSCSRPRAQRSTTSTTTSSAIRMKWVKLSNLRFEIALFSMSFKSEIVTLNSFMEINRTTFLPPGFLRGWRGWMQFIASPGLGRNWASSDQGFPSIIIMLRSGFINLRVFIVSVLYPSLFRLSYV